MTIIQDGQMDLQYTKLLHKYSDFDLFKKKSKNTLSGTVKTNPDQQAAI